MDWDSARITGSDSNKYKRWTKQAIENRKRARDTISDKGVFMLWHTWDSLSSRDYHMVGGVGQGDWLSTSVNFPGLVTPPKMNS